MGRQEQREQKKSHQKPCSAHAHTHTPHRVGQSEGDSAFFLFALPPFSFSTDQSPQSPSHHSFFFFLFLPSIKPTTPYPSHHHHHSQLHTLTHTLHTSTTYPPTASRSLLNIRTHSTKQFSLSDRPTSIQPSFNLPHFKRTPQTIHQLAQHTHIYATIPSISQCTTPWSKATRNWTSLVGQASLILILTSLFPFSTIVSKVGIPIRSFCMDSFLSRHPRFTTLHTLDFNTYHTQTQSHVYFLWRPCVLCVLLLFRLVFFCSVFCFLCYLPSAARKKRANLIFLSATPSVCSLWHVYRVSVSNPVYPLSATSISHSKNTDKGNRG